MRSKDVAALTVGLNLLGGIIAGLLVGYCVDYVAESWFGFKTSPWGLLIFFFVGIVSGFLNAYRDMKRITESS
ncbi:MAG: AtpZ/AtpI family protein [Aquificota bacterium]|nr:AtpZ/AtpI family protein [Aquificota bacterium]